MAHVPLNLDLIRARAADIRGELAHLRAYSRLSPDDFVRDEERVRAARYSLIVLVEAAAAICTHLAARVGRLTDSYSACFEGLGDMGIIDRPLALRLAALGRLRNLLVQGYGRVDDRRLHAHLVEGLGDLDRFLAAVAGQVRQETGEEV